MDFAALYTEDREAWAELQVAALRRLATTPGVWANTIDWENVIEEIQDVGSDQRRAVESLLTNALAHGLKIIADPDSLSAQQWSREVRFFLSQAQAKTRPAMRQRINLEEVWAEACRRAALALEAFDRAVPQLPPRCPLSFDDLLEGEFDLIAHLKAALARRGP